MSSTILTFDSTKTVLIGGEFANEDTERLLDIFDHYPYTSIIISSDITFKEVEEEYDGYVEKGFIEALTLIPSNEVIHLFGERRDLAEKISDEFLYRELELSLNYLPEIYANNLSMEQISIISYCKVNLAKMSDLHVPINADNLQFFENIIYESFIGQRPPEIASRIIDTIGDFNDISPIGPCARWVLSENNLLFLETNPLIGNGENMYDNSMDESE